MIKRLVLHHVLCVTAGLLWLHGEPSFAASPCQAGAHFMAVVLERDDAPPALSLVFSPGPNGRCTSMVQDAIVQKPSWELIEKGVGVEVTIDHRRIISELELRADRDIPKAAHEGAKAAGVR